MIYSLAFSNRDVQFASIYIYCVYIYLRKKKEKKGDGAATCERETFHTSSCDAPPAYSPLPSRPRPQASLHNSNGPSLYAERTVGKIIYKKSAWPHECDKKNQTDTQISQQRQHIEQLSASPSRRIYPAALAGLRRIVLVISWFVSTQRVSDIWNAWNAHRPSPRKSVCYVNRFFSSHLERSSSFFFYNYTGNFVRAIALLLSMAQFGISSRVASLRS